MTAIVLYSMLTLGAVAAVFATILYAIARRFAVEEDPRVAEVEELLPGINCGACGFPGCSGMAAALVGAADEGDISTLFCPPGGNETMTTVGFYFGLEVREGAPTTAVVRCGGSVGAAPHKVRYDGHTTCAVAHATHAGESGCPFGCFGLGDCVDACDFDAIRINGETGLPEVDPERCTSCGACVTACPRNLIAVVPRGRRDRRVVVNCRNCESGAIAKKNCSVACIACGQCKRVCDDIVQAITIDANLATIDPEKCISCGQCVGVCPTNAIVAGFKPPPPKPRKKPAAPAAPAAPAKGGAQ